MKVVLLEDVNGVGRKYEVKEVTDGFARNFLISKKLAKIAREEVIEWAKLQKEILEKKAEGDLKKFQEIASLIDGQEVTIEVKIGPEGQFFESVTAQKISERLKEMGFDIKRNQIILGEPIRELGEYPVKIKLEHNLETQIQVIVIGEAEKKLDNDTDHFRNS